MCLPAARTLAELQVAQGSIVLVLCLLSSSLTLSLAIYLSCCQQRPMYIVRVLLPLAGGGGKMGRDFCVPWNIYDLLNLEPILAPNTQ